MKTSNMKGFYLLIVFGFLFSFLSSCDNSSTETPPDDNGTVTERVTDIEGNVYRTVKIGTQVWMVENLQTTKFNDGTEIPTVASWNFPTTPVYCWYDIYNLSKLLHGALYNWYAVNTGKLAPAGWHVPTDADWTTLENYLMENGYNYDGTNTENKYAKAMASSSLWTNSMFIGVPGNIDFTTYRNKSGFTAYPAGARDPNGPYLEFGSTAYWWSSTEDTQITALTRSIEYNAGGVIRERYSKSYGFSVRCVKN